MPHNPTSQTLPSVAAPSHRIQTCNDQLRMRGVGGQTMMTAGVAALADDERHAVLEAVAAFDAFTPDNDPYGEHDCAALTIDGRSIVWKIDYYDLALTAHAPDPADPAVTRRVLTIMLAGEY